MSTYFRNCQSINYHATTQIKASLIAIFSNTAINNWLANADEASQVSIFNNFVHHNFDSESTGFVNAFISQSIINPTLNLDFQASTNSPTFIDLSSVIGNNPESIKFMEVYNSLTQSVGFKNLFIDLFGSTPLFNVKFVIEDLPQPSNGNLAGLCTAYQYPNDLAPFNLIRIDRNTLLNKSKINIAVIILHECIHAYLNIKLLNPNIGMAISSINNLDIQSCINTYFNNTAAENQHSFFVDFMIPSMTQILLDVKDDLTTPLQINELENPTNGAAILYAPMDSPPSISDIQIPWNWETLFNTLSYTGLQNCNEYPFNYPIQNLADYYHFHYIFAFNAIFNP